MQVERSVFATALGITAEHAEKLQTALLDAAATEEALPANSDRFGDRYIIDFTFDGPKGSGMVRSTWILRNGEDRPRLTTCYVK